MSPARFADLAAGGDALIPLLQEHAGAPATLVVALLPGGAPAAARIAAGLGTPVHGLEVRRAVAADGSLGQPEPLLDRETATALEGATVIVVDDGVESGTVARAVAPVLRAAGATRLVLAVPVCSRDAEATLRPAYDIVVAVDRPFARRSLHWHYATFEVPDLAAARALLR